MARSPEETRVWVAERIRQLAGVENVELRGSRSLRISRRKHAPFIAAILSETVVTLEQVEVILAADAEVDIVVSIPADAKWTGEAIAAAQGVKAAWGGLKDLMSAVSNADVRTYERSEYAFVARLLRQFGVVERVEREADRLWLLHRKRGLPAVRVVALDPYEMTADHLRTAQDRYGEFDIVFLNNPNGKATANANEVAAMLEVPILKARELGARLREP